MSRNDESPFNNYPIHGTFKVRRMVGIFQITGWRMIKTRRRYSLKAVEGTGALVETTEAFGEDMKAEEVDLKVIPELDQSIEVENPGVSVRVGSDGVWMTLESKRSKKSYTFQPINLTQNLYGDPEPGVCTDAIRAWCADVTAAAIAQSQEPAAEQTPAEPAPEATDAVADAIRSRSFTVEQAFGRFDDLEKQKAALDAGKGMPEGTFGGDLDEYSPGAQRPVVHSAAPSYAYPTPFRISSDLAASMTHRACTGSEHNPQEGKLHGYCLVCGVEWPCETAKYFLRGESK